MSCRIIPRCHRRKRRSPRVDTQFWIGFFHILIIDLVLSGDNAVVIGMASRNLPLRERKKAILWGTVGAVGLRVFFIGIITWLLEIPYLKIFGGCLLVWIAFKLLVQKEEDAPAVRTGKSLWDAVKIIVIADIAMSLDNALAIGGAAKGDFVLVTFGLMFSIPLLMWGSAIVARWMNEYPVLVFFGAGALVFVATSMILEDPALAAFLEQWNAPHLHTIIPIVSVVVTLAIGRWRRNAVYSLR